MGKNPLIAALLSFIIGGLGQVYLGLWSRAFFFFGLEAITGYLYYLNESETRLILNLLIGAWSMADAHYMAKHMKTEKQEPTKQIPKIKVF
ncbi:MAG: hypothetical protein KKD39_08380 [Candidatus Altiarchaeota archaeon]|nr:hypothetical protein [Candidatus Altiarchaeota archaeon]